MHVVGREILCVRDCNIVDEVHDRKSKIREFDSTEFIEYRES
jgi:hypothetical protein